MTKWEYGRLIQEIEEIYDTQYLDREITDMCDVGWEIVDIQTVADPLLQIILFKRLVDDPDARAFTLTDQARAMLSQTGGE
jgi:hypothetical protein